MLGLFMLIIVYLRMKLITKTAINNNHKHYKIITTKQAIDKPQKHVKNA